MENDEPKTKLHFTRVRSKGDSTYYDPQTDIRAVLPTAVKVTLDLLMQICRDDWVKKEFSYLARCYAVYQIRLAEDGEHLVKQQAEFQRAINKVSASTRFLWMENLFCVLNAIYGLFTRRDVKTDGAAIRGMLNTAQQSALLSLVSQEQADDIITKFQERGKLYAENPCINPNGVAVCEETDQVVENIKELAGVFISHEGPSDWNSLSEACDAYFMSDEGDQLDDKSKMAVALAYPSYEKPYLDVEVDNDKPS